MKLMPLPFTVCATMQEGGPVRTADLPEPSRARPDRARRHRGRPTECRPLGGQRSRSMTSLTRQGSGSCCSQRSRSGCPDHVAAPAAPLPGGAFIAITVTQDAEYACVRPSRRAASAIPTPIGSPWPNDPVEISTPGIPCASHVRQARAVDAVGLQPFGREEAGSASTAYNAAHPWPLLRMKRSRSGHSGSAGRIRRTLP